MIQRRKFSNSKKMAWTIIIISTILTTYSIYHGLEGIGVAIWTSGIPSGVGLYINKQFQMRKEFEATVNSEK